MLEQVCRDSIVWLGTCASSKNIIAKKTNTH